MALLHLASCPDDSSCGGGGPHHCAHQIFSLLPGQLPVATLLPLCTTWMIVVAGGPDPSLTMNAQAQNPFCY